jgi:hypothetical protein
MIREGHLFVDIDSLYGGTINVRIVQEPETFFQHDVTAVKRILSLPKTDRASLLHTAS